MRFSRTGASAHNLSPPPAEVCVRTVDALRPASYLATILY